MTEREPITPLTLPELVIAHSANKGDDAGKLAENARNLLATGYSLLAHLHESRGMPRDQINHVITESMHASADMDLMRCEGCGCTALSPCQSDSAPCGWSWSYMCTVCSRKRVFGMLNRMRLSMKLAVPAIPVGGRRQDGPIEQPGLGVIECDHPHIIAKIIAEQLQCKPHMLDAKSNFPYLSVAVLPNEPADAALALRTMNTARDRIHGSGVLIILAVQQDRLAEIHAHAAELYSRSPFFCRLRTQA